MAYEPQPLVRRQSHIASKKTWSVGVRWWVRAVVQSQAGVKRQKVKAPGTGGGEEPHQIAASVSRRSFGIRGSLARLSLLFVGGVMSLLWIVLFALLILLEKVTSFGRFIAPLAGIVFAASAWLFANGNVLMDCSDRRRSYPRSTGPAESGVDYSWRQAAIIFDWKHRSSRHKKEPQARVRKAWGSRSLALTLRLLS